MRQLQLLRGLLELPRLHVRRLSRPARPTTSPQILHATVAAGVATATEAVAITITATAAAVAGSPHLDRHDPAAVEPAQLVRHGGAGQRIGQRGQQRVDLRLLGRLCGSQRP